MSANSERVKRWRERTKARVVEAMGGKCVCCGYNRCMWAFDLHHRDPSKKEFALGRIRANIISWAKLVKEAEKCVLVCSNCHREIHRGLTQVPENAQGFDMDYADYKTLEKSAETVMNACPICNTMKPKALRTCSLSCAAKKAGSIDWESTDLTTLLKTKSIMDIAEGLGASDGAVRKRIAKMARLEQDKNTPCPGCGKLYDRKHRGQKYCSETCAHQAIRKATRPSKEVLELEIRQASFVSLGKKYGVSDNAVRKWARTYDII